MNLGYYVHDDKETVQSTYGALRFVSLTASGAAARSSVDALTLRAVTGTVLLDHTSQSRRKALLLVSDDASAKSPRRASGTVTLLFALAPAVRLGSPDVLSSAKLRGPIGTKGQA